MRRSAVVSFFLGLVGGAVVVFLAALSLLAYLVLGVVDAPRPTTPGHRTPTPHRDNPVELR